MGTSYPDKTNFTGVWKLSDIYKNKISDGTYPRGSTRGIMGGGASPSNTNVIDFITIETTGDAPDFGDLGTARYCGTAVSNSTRQIFMAGYESDYVTTMEYVHYASTGNAADFGDLVTPTRHISGCSDSHGGIGE